MGPQERKDPWNALAHSWDQRGDARQYAELAFDSLQPYIGGLERTSSRILDFGAGTGLLSERLAPLVDEVVAIDTSRKMLEVLEVKRLNNVTTLCLSLDVQEARTHPVLAPGFDVVVASSVCAFVPNLETTLLAIATVMKSDGTFVQ